MWRSPLASRILLRALAAGKGTKIGSVEHPHRPTGPLHLSPFSSAPSPSPAATPPPARDLGSDGYQAAGAAGGKNAAGEPISFAEARKLMRLVNVESLKRRLGKGGEEVIGYSELLEVCEGMGVARSHEEAEAFARVLDEAGVVLLFRDKVYLHPDKVVDLMRKAVPLALTAEDDPRRVELKELQKKKEEIDLLAHKQVRRILWSGLGFFICQVGLFFRLTFWEFSWDVMEPIAFFTTTAGLIVGYGYFLFTSRDPTYRDLMHRLFNSRQKKLIQKQNFNMERYLELERRCKNPLDDSKGTGLDAFLRD